MLCGVCELYIELCAIPIIADRSQCGYRHRSRSGRKEGKGASLRSGDGAHGSSGSLGHNKIRSAGARHHQYCYIQTYNFIPQRRFPIN